MLELIHTICLIIAFAAGTAQRSSTQAARLHTSAPADITIDAAADHVRAANIAALITGTDAAELLAIAWHESRYQQDKIQREPPDRFGHPRWSCGVMTPEPMTNLEACRENTRSLLAGYTAGAWHLRAWLDQCHGDRTCALRGYAGAAGADCARAPTRGCAAARDFALRARSIR